MNNFPENEKNTENLPENEVNTEIIADDDSTIFSAPVKHKKTAEDFKRKKLLPKILAAFVAVVILGTGTFAVIKFIPEKEVTTSKDPVVEEIEVLSVNSSDFKNITVYNNNGTFKLYSKSDSSSSTSSDTSAVVTWYMEGYNDGILSSASIESIAYSVGAVSASRKVTSLTPADCGLDNPKIKAVAVDNNGKTITLLFGNETPDHSGYYFKISESDEIYVVSSDLKETLDFTAVSLANTDMISAFPLENISSSYKTDAGVLNTFDKLTLSGKNISQPLVITHIADEYTTGISTYKIISPTRRIASDELESVLEIFKSGISVTGAYALDTSAKTLSTLGLDKPDFEAKMEIEGKVHTFKFKLQADGNYAAISNLSKIVKMVSTETVAFVDKQTSYFYSDWVAINFIDDLKSFTFKAGDKSYTFSLEANPDTEAEDSYLVTCDGKNYKSLPFQQFYEDCISIKCSDFTTDKVSGEPTYAIIFDYKDDLGVDEVVEFTKYSETKYQYSVNGYDLGKVTASSLRSLENSLKKLLEEGIK